MEMFLQQENRECKWFFRLDVESFDKESVFVAGRHTLHCTIMLLAFCSFKTKYQRNSKKLKHVYIVS